jgi:hypothetical protein
LREFDLSGAKPILPRGGSVSWSLLKEAFRLEEKFEVDHGFHRTPLVQGCLEVLQHVSPGAASLAQCHLPNKPYSLCCAAQYYPRASADTQLRINGKVRHGLLTRVPLPKFHPRSNFVPKIRPCSRHRPPKVL